MERSNGQGDTHGWLPGLSETYCGAGGGRNTLDPEEITCEACLEPLPVRVAAEQVRACLGLVGESPAYPRRTRRVTKGSAASRIDY